MFDSVFEGEGLELGHLLSKSNDSVPIDLTSLESYVSVFSQAKLFR